MKHENEKKEYSAKDGKKKCFSGEMGVNGKGKKDTHMDSSWNGKELPGVHRYMKGGKA